VWSRGMQGRSRFPENFFKAKDLYQETTRALLTKRTSHYLKMRMTRKIGNEQKDHQFCRDRKTKTF
jgi:hypothetical protein